MKEDKQTTGISATSSGLKLLQENIGIISTITWENERFMLRVNFSRKHCLS